MLVIEGRDNAPHCPRRMESLLGANIALMPTISDWRQSVARAGSPFVCSDGDCDAAHNLTVKIYENRFDFAEP